MHISQKTMFIYKNNSEKYLPNQEDIRAEAIACGCPFSLCERACGSLATYSVQPCTVYGHTSGQFLPSFLDTGQGHHKIFGRLLLWLQILVDPVCSWLWHICSRTDPFAPDNDICGLGPNHSRTEEGHRSPAWVR